MREKVTKTCKCGRQIPLNVKACKECRSLLDKAFYKAHTVQKVESVTKRKRELVDWYRALKTNKPCFDCGNCYHFSAMDFDHRDAATKKDDISHMVRVGLSKETVLAEIAKTILLCSNCHRVRTFNRLKGKTYGR